MAQIGPLPRNKAPIEEKPAEQPSPIVASTAHAPDVLGVRVRWCGGSTQVSCSSTDARSKTPLVGATELGYTSMKQGVEDESVPRLARLRLTLLCVRLKPDLNFDYDGPERHAWYRDLWPAESRRARDCRRSLLRRESRSARADARRRHPYLPDLSSNQDLPGFNGPNPRGASPVPRPPGRTWDRVKGNDHR